MNYPAGSAAASLATTGFGPENLPYGSFRVGRGKPRLGARLGDSVLDLAALATAVPGLEDDRLDAVTAPNLDRLLAAGASVWRAVRAWLVEAVLSPESAGAVAGAAINLADVSLMLPFTPGDYVDYYASEHHATNIGAMFRPNEEALKPNWKHLPIGYHGRSGTVVVSGTDVRRPKGLLPPVPGSGEGAAATPRFGACQRLDIECEMGFVVGGSAPHGEVSVRTAADEHLFGAFLFNDWSARDIQNYEYVPLGPYLGKSFASSVGAWVVPFDALRAAAMVEAPERDYELAAYLDDGPDAGGPYGIDATMTVAVDGEIVSRPPYRLMYYTAPQMIAHMTVNGASLRPGDMFGSGTVSGPEKNERGSFIELSWGGKEPLQLADGAEMVFLADGQTVTLGATAPGPDGSVIDFGECVGKVLPST